MHNLEIEKLTEIEWREFIAGACASTVYEQPHFLAAYERSVAYWGCRQGSRIVAGLAAIEADRAIVRLPCQQYNGLVFADDAYQKPATRIGSRYRIADAFAHYIMATYRAADLAHSPDVVDIRAFDWVHYHDPAAPRFSSRICYTTILDIRRPQDRSGYQVLRRRSLAKAEKQGLSTARSADVDLLSQLVTATYARQGIRLKPEETRTFRAIARAVLTAGTGRLFVTSRGGQPLSGALFAVHRDRAFYVIGGGDAEDRDANAGSKVMADAFIALAQDDGITEVDLVGVNSPNRGAFKLSFGGDIRPYYQTIKQSDHAR